MANPATLLPGGTYKFTDEDRQKAREARSRNALERETFHKIFNALLDKRLKNKDGTEISVREAGAMKQVEKFLKGDPKAFELIRDSIGEKPMDKVIVAEVDPDVMADLEKDLYEDES